jgi:S-DNA-T family DNA segregation ATPase FtsK/SpoIIIE
MMITAGGLLVIELIEGPIVWWAAGGAASAGLAVAGRRKDGSGGAAVIRPRSIAWAMDGNNLVTAFRDAKLIGKDEGLAFVQLPKRDGSGWAVTVDLPASRKASTVIAKREDLASALAVDEVQLIAERVRGKGGHAGRLSLWIADDDPYAANSLDSPLGEAESWDFWQATPFGTTARGQVVNLPLVWTSLLVGAIPRMGKTYAARIPVTAAALDPHVRLIVADGKGGKDWKAFELVAHRLIPNARADSILRLIAVLEEAAADVETRFARLAEMDDEVCPESKVTQEITRNPSHAMPLTVIAIDEIQNYLADDTPLDTAQPKGKKRGQRVLELLTFIAKTGPPAGFVLVLATQKPDSQVIPDKLRGQLGTRFALKVMTYQASETILGAGTYRAGMDASKLLKSHRGVGLLLGADGETDLDAGEAVAVRTHLLHIKAVRTACQRGRALREAAGTLTGDAAGNEAIGDLPSDVAARIEQAAAVFEQGVRADVANTELPEVLALLVDVINEHEIGVVATAELAARIDWDAKSLGEALRRAGVPAPRPSRQRINGSVHPVSVTDLDAVRVAAGFFSD